MQEIKHIRGDTLIFDGVVNDEVGTVNLTGSTIIACVRAGRDKENFNVVLQKNASITNASLGEYEIEFTSTETGALELIPYYMDIQLTDSLGKVTTLAQIQITIGYDNA